MKVFDLWDSEERITETAIEDSSAKRISPGSVLIVVRSGILKHSLPVAVARVPLAINQDLKALHCTTDLDADFLARFLKATAPRILRWVRATTAENIPVERLRELVIPIPPLCEQRRIAEVLAGAENLRVRRRATLAQLEILSQALFLELFGDPTTNPKGWTKRAFTDVCETRLGKMLDQKQQIGNNRRPYLRNANVQWFRFDLSEVFQMDFDSNARTAFSLKDGDLLICEGGEPGRAAIWRGQIRECYYQKALHRARPRDDLATPDYLAWLLWFLAHRGGLGNHVTSATIAHLTGEKLKAMSIPVPPISLQREFARRIAIVEKLKIAHRTSLADLDRLFGVLQYRAFRGEL